MSNITKTNIAKSGIGAIKGRIIRAIRIATIAPKGIAIAATIAIATIAIIGGHIAGIIGPTI